MTAPAVEHVYSPRGTAVSLLECRDPEVLLSGPAGTGKSRACLEKLHLMCLLNPGMRALIVRKTAVSLTSTALVTFEEHVAKESLAAGHLSWFGGSTREPPGYRYKNKSRVNVGGMDKSTKIMSSEYDLVYVQEAIELSKGDWEAIITRLRNGKVSFQQLIADTNPDRETHWLHQRAIGGTTTMLESRHQDNPVYYDDNGEMTPAGHDYIVGKLDKLTGLRKLRLRDGKWVSAEGIIYEGFDRHTHLVPRYKVPDDWTRWWVVDFGFVHPFAAQWWAQDPDGRLVMYREILKTQTLVEDHARTMLRAVTRLLPDQQDTGDDIAGSVRDGRRVWTEPKPRAVICDHDAEDRATLERHLGMSTSPAHKSVSDGIQAVAARLKPAGDGKPRLTIMEDSLIEVDRALAEAEKPICLVEEIPGYIWDTGGGKKLKEAPLKELDDADDAMRYVVAECDLGSRPRIRSIGSARRRR